MAPVEEMVPPYELAPDVLEVWERTVADLESMGVASSADVHLLAGFCEAAALHARVSRELIGQPLLVAGSRSEVLNRLLALQERAAVLALRFGQEFGLSPTARRRIDTVAPAPRYSGRNPIVGPTKPNPFAG
jgi:P27 family predicted phage terminase small subunit